MRFFAKVFFHACLCPSEKIRAQNYLWNLLGSLFQSRKAKHPAWCPAWFLNPAQLEQNGPPKKFRIVRTPLSCIAFTNLHQIKIFTFEQYVLLCIIKLRKDPKCLRKKWRNTNRWKCVCHKRRTSADARKTQGELDLNSSTVQPAAIKKNLGGMCRLLSLWFHFIISIVRID